jgi:HPt (histidine-containing phosphotransfer) domain-containing protein/two-component sensor histidine kinase
MNRDIHLILDNVSQGLLTVQMDGALSAEHSRVVADWFGKPVAGQRVWDYFAASDTTYAAWLRVGWDTLADDILPAELVLAQLPFRLVSKERTYELSYRLIRDEGGVERVLFVVNDATERLAREQADAVQRETIDVFRFVSRDRQGFVDFMLETSSQVAQLALPETPEGDAGARRIVHTIKGNSALFAVSSVAATCEAVEHRAAENESVITPADRAEVTAAWNAAEARVRDFLGEAKVGIVEIEEAEIQAVMETAASDGGSGPVLEQLAAWRNEPTRQRLTRFAEQAKSLALRLGRGEIEVVVEDGRLRLPKEPLCSFWSALIHVVRNAVDHGLRGAPNPRLVLSTSVVDGRLVVGVADNGPGIDWDRVLARATSLGLPTATRADLVEALFSDGLSTRDEVTEISGRGVGLAAVREACAELGATVSAETGAHGGTKFAFTFPKDAFWSAPASRAA